MLTSVHPKLPMRNKKATLEYYGNQLGFKKVQDYGDYLMVARDQIEIHFFLFADVEPAENYGQIYIRTNNIGELYNSFVLNKVEIHPNGKLQTKPWGQKEFALLDPDSNLLTFGENS